jgi:hypothetical protein
MRTRNLYRASEGDLDLVTTPQEAVIDGRYDANNWGHEWVLISARNEDEAREISRRYDANLNSGARVAPTYLRPVSRWTEFGVDR